jgi:hypothetical protein
VWFPACEEKREFIFVFSKRHCLFKKTLGGCTLDLDTTTNTSAD